MTPLPSSAINAKIDSYPALPATVTNVLAVTADPDSSASDLMNAILPDQAMCSAILKVANSAFFGIPRGVSTIERAVVVLGYEEIRNIVIGKAIFASFPKLDKNRKQDVGLFWEHAFTCGLAAKIIAEHYKLSGNEFFIAGLIHDIGKLAMLMTFSDKYPFLMEFSDTEYFHSTAKEQSLFSISHDQAGLRLANKWMFPEQLVMATGYHHDPASAPSFKQYPLIIQLADILSLLYCYSDVSSGEDVEKIFTDFLPETKTLWEKNKIPFDPASTGAWFEILKEKRESDQAILDILSG
ncbi:MAG: HDOD domain-containing protein [Desulfobulbaceae bacterium]|nr:HDOD domain-containing protein [Desulfobulbaceae bacterium]